MLINLKEIGYEVGAGFMIGLPNQSNEDLVNDLLFIKKLNPHMCGIGPFIPQKDTPLLHLLQLSIPFLFLMDLYFLRQ